MKLGKSKASTDKYSALVSHQHKAVWYKVRKCASISIGNSLPGDDWISVNNNRNVRQFEQDYFGNYFRFAFVRNPFGRLVSNYLHKIKDKTRQEIRPSYIRHLDFSPGMSFDDFALQICNLPEDKCDRHYRSMHTSIDLNNIDFIGRLENFDSDFQEVVRAIKPEQQTDVSHLNRQGEYNYRDFYSAQLEQRVADRYQVDLRLFGYGFGRMADSEGIHETLSRQRA